MRDGGIDLGRVAALSDGIFAVAMTLLVVALPLPKNAAELGGVPLCEHLLTLLPPVRAIMISFLVAAVFWRAHHGFFSCLAQTLTVGLYAANLALIGCSLFLMWLRAAARRALLHPEVETQRVRHALWIFALITLVFLGSIGVAWSAPKWAMWTWLLILPLSALVPRRLARRQT